MGLGADDSAASTRWITRALAAIASIAICLALAFETCAGANIGVLVGPDAFVSTLSDQPQYIRPRNAIPIGGIMAPSPSQSYGRLEQPTAIAIAPNGRSLYIAEPTRHRILRVNTVTHTIRPFAGGSGPGNRLTAHSRDGTQLNGPRGLAVSADSKTLYVADTNNSRLLAIDVRSGKVGEISIKLSDQSESETGSERHGPLPTSVAVTPDGSSIFVGDGWHHRVLRIDRQSGRVELFAGDEPASDGELFASDTALNTAMGGPVALAVSRDGRSVFIVDDVNDRVLRVDTQSSAITTIAGHDLFEEPWGTDSRPKLTAPMGVAITPDDRWIVVADSMNNRVVRFEVEGVRSEVVLGPQDEEPAPRLKGDKTPRLNNPTSVAVAPEGSILVADRLNNRIVFIGAEEVLADEIPEKVAIKNNKAIAEEAAEPFKRLRVKLTLTMLGDVSTWCSVL